MTFKYKHEYKDKIKDSPIHEFVACERLWFKLQTFHLTKNDALPTPCRTQM